MGKFWRQLKQNVKVNKEGIIAGLITGFLAAKYMIYKGMSISFANETQGLFDSLATVWDLSLAQIAEWKVILGFMIIFAMVGWLIDSLIPEMTWRRVKKKLVG